MFAIQFSLVSGQIARCLLGVVFACVEDVTGLHFANQPIKGLITALPGRLGRPIHVGGTSVSQGDDLPRERLLLDVCGSGLNLTISCSYFPPVSKWTYLQHFQADLVDPCILEAELSVSRSMCTKSVHSFWWWWECP